MISFTKRTQKGLQSLGLKVIRYRYVVLLLTLVCTGYLCQHLPDLNIATTLESSFKSRNTTIQDYQEFRDMFGRDDKIILLIKSEDIFSTHFLARLREFHRDLENTLPLLSEVRSIINAEYIEGKNGELHVSRLFEKFPETSEEAQIIKEKVTSYPLYKNLYISKNNDFVLVIVKTQAVSALTRDGRRIINHGRGVPDKKGPATATGENRKSISQVENAAIIGILETAVKQYSTENFRIVFSGTPVYQYQVEPMIRENMVAMSGMVFALTFTFMALLFRRVSGIFLPQFVVLMGLGATLGLMALAKVPFTLSTSMLPSILLSVGLTAPIHFMVVFFKYQKRVGRIRAIIRTLGHSGLPICMTSMTTIAGLLSFSFTDIAPVAHMGIFAAIGIWVCLCLTLISLPAVISILNILPGKDRERLYEDSVYNRALIWMGRTGIYRSKDIYIISLIAFIVLLPGFAKLNFSHNMLHYFSDDDPFIKQTELIEIESSGFRALEIIVDTKRKNGILQHHVMDSFEKIETFALEQNSLSGLPITGKILSILGILRRTNQAWHGNDQAHFVTPQEDKVIRDQLLELQRKAPEILLEYTDRDFRLARFTVMMYWKDAAMDVDFVERLRAFTIQQFGDDVRVVVTGVVPVSSSVIKTMMISLVVGYLAAFVMIAFFMIVSVGETKLGLVAMIPNIFPIYAGLAMMGHLDIPLNTYNLIGGSIVIGIAVDDTIHFFHNFRNYYLQSGNVESAVTATMRSTGRALITTTLILVSCFWLRLFSPLKVISDFGLVMGFSLLVAFLGDVLVAPALLSRLYRKEDNKINDSVKKVGILTATPEMNTGRKQL